MLRKISNITKLRIQMQLLLLFRSLKMMEITQNIQFTLYRLRLKCFDETEENRNKAQNKRRNVKQQKRKILRD